MKKTWIGCLSLLALMSCSSDDDEKTAAVNNFTLKGAGSEAAAKLTQSEGGPEYGIDTGSLKIKLYEFWASTSEDCTDMVKIYENTAPEFTDLLSNPTFGSGGLADGTYKCISYVMSDNLKFTAKEASSDGACQTGVELDLDVCRGGNDDVATSGEFPDGTAFTCAEKGDDKVAFYVSTVSKADGEGNQSVDVCKFRDGQNGENSACTAFRKPSATYPYRGVPLANEIVKSGSMTGFVIIDGSGKVGSGNDNGTPKCDMAPPKFSFKAVKAD